MAALSVLIVDDDVDFAESLGDLVRFYGHSVDLVHSGEGALAAIVERAYDMVFLDIRMPDHSGLELYPKLKELSPQSCIVFATAYIADVDRNASVQARWAELLEKPSGINKVEELLRRVGGERSVVLIDAGDGGSSAAVRSALDYRGHRVRAVPDIATAITLLTNSDDTDIISAVLGDYRQSDGTLDDLIDRLAEHDMSFPIVLLDQSGYEHGVREREHVYVPRDADDEREILELVQQCESLFSD